ncbi:MAG: pyrroline-5-carboxylate reductase [candidate division WS1 bacterium]|jgi:pyrroline-5-carboxylate reductase|nr:pyrroline-5-carboxylate reductase [candidate division WS1 bacterium]
MSDSTARYRLGVIGSGVMGRAMLNAALRARVLGPDEVIAADVSEACRRAVADLGCPATDDNRTVVAEAPNLLVALKPQVIHEVLRDLRNDFRDGQLIISIAAGVTLEALRESVGAAPALVRVMPNICCTVHEAATAWTAAPGLGDEQREFVQALLEASGEAVEVEEKLMDAVTGLSGSGPAFVALFVEALADGGVKAGLPRAQASRLAAQTTLGAARWLLENDQSPAALKDMVSSPGGTTIAGVAALEARAFRAAVIEAVVAAAERARELGG